MMILAAPEISVVVPCYNEEAVLPVFFERVGAVLERQGVDYEIIFVNDGSRDATAAVIRAMCFRDPRVKLVDLSRNFGKEIAMTAGIDFSAGTAVVVIDADLQDPPELIPAMIDLWREGNDVVYATRSGRDGETALKKITAHLFYWVLGRLSRVRIPENTGDFRLMSRRAVDALKLIRERHRFMKGLFSWIGYRQTSVTYRRDPRFAGSTKWSYWKLWNLAIEGITSFSYGPLQAASFFGAVIALLAVCYAIFLIVRVCIYGIDVPGYASIMVTILFIGAVQLITLGIMGEYIGRLFNEAKQRPLYLVQEMVGIESQQAASAHGLSEDARK